MRQQLGVHGRHVADTDIVAGGHTGQHGGHVVEKHLDKGDNVLRLSLAILLTGIK